MGRMEIKIQFCPTIWESDSGERIGQGSFRCASSLAPVRVAAGFRSLQGHVEARSGERIGLGTLQVRVEPRSSARRGALQVSVGARFRWASGRASGSCWGALRCASSLAPVRVVGRFRCALGRASGRFGVSFRVLSRRAQVSELARNASGARRGKLQGRVEARSVERIGFRCASSLAPVRVEPRFSARRGALRGRVKARFRARRLPRKGYASGFENGWGTLPVPAFQTWRVDASVWMWLNKKWNGCKANFTFVFL